MTPDRLKILAAAAALAVLVGGVLLRPATPRLSTNDAAGHIR